MFAKHWVKLMVMTIAGFALIILSCSDEVADPIELDLNKPLVVRHITSDVGSAIVIDGQVDAAWNDAEEYEYIIYDMDSVPFILTLQALTDSTHFFLLARWGDPVEDIRPNFWLWDPARGFYRTGGQDFFCAIFDDGRNGTVGVDCAQMCHRDEMDVPDAMINPGPGMIDAWVWMSGLTNPVGTLEDIHYSADSSFREDDQTVQNAYVLNYGGAQNPDPVWMPEDAPYHRTDFMFYDEIIDFHQIIEPQLDSIPGYYLNDRSTFTGTSKWEVDAKGTFDNALGQWVVEFRRELDTGHDDDIPFVLGETINCAIGVTDNPHFNSPYSHVGRSPIEIRF
jgi:hypothetical protein